MSGKLVIAALFEKAYVSEPKIEQNHLFRSFLISAHSQFVTQNFIPQQWMVSKILKNFTRPILAIFERNCAAISRENC